MNEQLAGNGKGSLQEVDSIFHAFSMVYLMANELEIESFIERWGGVTLEICFQVLKEGEGEDRLVALFLLGSNAEVRVRDWS